MTNIPDLSILHTVSNQKLDDYAYTPESARLAAEGSLTVLRMTYCFSLALCETEPSGKREVLSGSYSTSREIFSHGKLSAMESIGTTRQS